MFQKEELIYQYFEFYKNQNLSKIINNRFDLICLSVPSHQKLFNREKKVSSENLLAKITSMSV